MGHTQEHVARCGSDLGRYSTVLEIEFYLQHFNLRFGDRSDARRLRGNYAGIQHGLQHHFRFRILDNQWSCYPRTRDSPRLRQICLAKGCI